MTQLEDLIPKVTDSKIESKDAKKLCEETREAKQDKDHAHGHNGNHDTHDHGDDHGLHAAKHELEHRTTEKVGLATVEHVFDHAAQTLGERMLEHASASTGERMAEEAAGALSRKLVKAASGHLESSMERVAEAGMERITEATVERVAEASIERVAEASMERAAEAAVERVAEATSERLLERTAESVGERVVERVGERIVVKPTQLAANMTATGVAQRATSSWEWLLPTIKIIRDLVPVAGTLFVAYMAKQDVKRVKREWDVRRSLLSPVLIFVVAMLGDFVDLAVHAMVVAGTFFIHVDHHVLHSFERMGMIAAIVATLSMIIGEIISGCSWGRLAAPPEDAATDHKKTQ